MPPSAPRITLDYAIVQTHISTLQSACQRLQEIGTKYKEGMDSMSSSWQGESGKSFAEAAGRVEAGFVVNRTALEVLIRGGSGATRFLAQRDEAIGRSVKTVCIE